MDDLTSDDCRLLLSLIKFSIVPADQRERIKAWLGAKRDGIRHAPEGVRVQNFVRRFTVTAP